MLSAVSLQGCGEVPGRAAFRSHASGEVSEMGGSSCAVADRRTGAPLCRRLDDYALSSLPRNCVPHSPGESVSRHAAQRKQGRIRLGGYGGRGVQPLPLSPVRLYRLLVAGAPQDRVGVTSSPPTRAYAKTTKTACCRTVRGWVRS